VESFRILNLLHSRSEYEKPPLSIPKASQSSASSQSPAFRLLSFQSSQSSASSQSRALSVSTSSALSLSTLSLSPLSLSFTLAFAQVALCVFRLSKRLVFYFVFVWKACKGCSFKWLFMQKDVFFFCLLNDLRVKFWFLCDFWWKRKSFWLFHCSVLDLKKFLCLGFDFCWFWSKVCSFMSFTWSFLVLGGEKNVFVSVLSDFSWKMMILFVCRLIFM